MSPFFPGSPGVIPSTDPGESLEHCWIWQNKTKQTPKFILQLNSSLLAVMIINILWEAYEIWPCFNGSNFPSWLICVLEAFPLVINFFLFQVMDYNINLGKHLLPLVVQVLKYCSCPQLRHYFQQPPRCSLWSLKPHIRQMWLKALLVILYKVSCCSHPWFGRNNLSREKIA